jgi:hypothetical protein
VLSTAKNVGSGLSDKGFNTLIRRARGDDALTSCVAMRSDLPPQLFDPLLATASEKVRVKLQSEREYAKSEIDTVVGEVAGKIHTAAATQPISYAAFAHVERADGGIEQNMRDTQAESLLVFAKAIGLSWETTRSIMMLAAKRYRRSPAAVDQAIPAFHRLRQSTAQQILDFHRMPSRPAPRH